MHHGFCCFEVLKSWSVFCPPVFWRCFTGNKKTNPCGETFLAGDGCFPKKGGQLNLLTSYFFHLSRKAVDFSELLVIFASTHLLGKISYLKRVFLMYWKPPARNFLRLQVIPPGRMPVAGCFHNKVRFINPFATGVVLIGGLGGSWIAKNSRGNSYPKQSLLFFCYLWISAK